MLIEGKHYYRKDNLEYPVDIHDRHYNFLATKIMEVTDNMRSKKHFSIYFKILRTFSANFKKISMLINPKIIYSF